jgi:GNAT superfamily N-acetyltransferase
MTVVRPARPEDLPRVVELLAAGTLRGGEDPSDLAPYRRALAEISADPDSEVLVADDGGQVIGLCQLITFRHLQERGGRCAEIESVHVDERRRSQGVGATLLEAAVARAQQLGCYRVQLTSNKARVDAHRFYERHGFVATHDGFKRYL